MHNVNVSKQMATLQVEVHEHCFYNYNYFEIADVKASCKRTLRLSLCIRTTGVIIA